ncbi:MAG: tripartite tricarboxylate transporter substrate binding protein [Hydrogenophaga sp.]|jgi:tripartite-type tricarboxylate transporter receptor subunit TctC|uniref:Bug family tripartite tricarboxylate transporter substrate binding protein n=1 Tax=Hydrogenophaga sp. TaxID=1904254 RepID=UPI0025B9179A|nr:tripartite tricarboxylate transporter substrate binding protein [Hydrogenophaga sp.]MDO9133847.1 tripartite tricarboxylate transporter substrate binding protein [Hydrogenophaga sp.]MDO9504336.1 tripartite tricarboxylate transporter substrate binding protein [Hydrogenophaga sp.]MDP1782167.1 tripartite tricarboxylate transporter substrate binding protein [Hydrogenophaga sp.]MDP2251899.1 tripartite tricarboxylate transporter substrate binding protein [Hydrogenophaga sp.]MDP2987440.1 tripartite
MQDNPLSTSRRHLVAALPAACLLSVFAPAAWAQADYPSRALRVIVPQPPGGGFDFVARALGERLAKRLGQPVVVENRTGSGTLIGTDAAAKAAPDGYTLLTGSVSNMVLNMGLYKSLSYDSLRDFEPVGLAVSYSYTLIARADLPFKTLAEVVAHAKANPGKLTYASAGNGSGQHVLAAALWQLAGIEITHVPYRGAQAAYTDLLGGRVDMFFDLTPTTRSHIESGKVFPLAVSGAERNALQPTVPTINETGVARLDLESWFGYFAPRGTPPAALQRLRTELAAVIAEPELRDVFTKAGGKPLTISVEQTSAMLKRDVERWTALIRAANISLD